MMVAVHSSGAVIDPWDIGAWTGQVDWRADEGRRFSAGTVDGSYISGLYAGNCKHIHVRAVTPNRMTRA